MIYEGVHDGGRGKPCHTEQHFANVYCRYRLFPMDSFCVTDSSSLTVLLGCSTSGTVFYASEPPGLTLSVSTLWTTVNTRSKHHPLIDLPVNTNRWEVARTCSDIRGMARQTVPHKTTLCRNLGDIWRARPTLPHRTALCQCVQIFEGGLGKTLPHRIVLCRNF